MDSERIGSLIREITPDAVALRRELHAAPELSFREHATARRVAERLRAVPGLEVRENVAGTGVVALLRGAGPCIALRAELDALPINEETGAPHASRNPGVMHACGHDGHVAMLVAAATVLAAVADQIAGSVKFIFQPAEEDGAGADGMCRAGVLADPPVSAIFSLHGWSQGNLGEVAATGGPASASTDTIHLTVLGRGAHGGHPDHGIDPIVVSARIVDALQTIASRSISPMDPVVVTIGSIHGGSAVNVIPPTVEMSGTIRTLDEAVRQRVRQLADRLIRRTAEAHGAHVDLEIREGYPVTVNNPGMSEFVLQTAEAVLGAEKVVRGLRPSTGAEDFAYYLREVPGSTFRLGLRPPGRESYPAPHQPDFDFNDDAIGPGLLMLTGLATRFSADSAWHCCAK